MSHNAGVHCTPGREIVRIPHLGPTGDLQAAVLVTVLVPSDDAIGQICSAREVAHSDQVGLCAEPIMPIAGQQSSVLYTIAGVALSGATMNVACQLGHSAAA